MIDTIGLEIETITETIPPEIYHLIEDTNLDEGFDYKNSKFIVIGKQNGKYVGLVAYGETQVGERVYPRFLHIIITPEFKRTKTAYRMLKESEQELKKKGDDIILCYIRYDLPNREMKKNYALKFGYKWYHNDNLGEHFYKKLKES